MSDQPRMVRIATLWQRRSAKGTTYFSGFMGDVQVLLFDGGEKPHPTRPDEVVHEWRLMVQERDPARRPAQAPKSPQQPGAAPRQQQRAVARATDASRPERASVAAQAPAGEGQ